MISAKLRVYEILEVAKPEDRASTIFDTFLISLIAVNALALILGTVEEVRIISPIAFRAIEAVSVSIFTLEYLLRVWSCTTDPNYSRPIMGRLSYVLAPLQVIDLLAILPFFIVFFFDLGGLDLRFLRAMRLLARVGKLSRYSSGVRTLGRVLHAKREELLTVVLVLSILLVLASSLMFFAEKNAQPDKFANIPSAMWWSIITLTTVGYGDVFPVTIPGRIVAGLIAIVGIGLFALPAGILGSGFLEEIQSRAKAVQICPHCGEEIHE